MADALGHDAPTSWSELSTLVDDVQRARAAVAAAQSAEAEVLARAVEIIQKRGDERRSLGQSTANDLPLREVAAELGCAMRVSDRTAQRRIDDAYALVIRYPVTFESWKAGRIERAHATVIADEGDIIGDDALRLEYEQLIVPVAEIESAARLREIARAIAAQLDPEGARERLAAARKSCDVRAYDLGDGLGRLIADLPAPLAFAIMDRLTEQAKLIKTVDDEDAVAAAGTESETGTEVVDAGEPAAQVESRTLGQIRADILADTLLTAAPTAHVDDPRLTGLAAIRGTVRVTIPLATLAGVGEEPALLDGIGPIDPDLVRRIAAIEPGWDVVFTHGCTGLPVAVDRYRPSAELKRFLRARDERCRFPGCRRHAEHCDLDHTIDAAHGGQTSTGNLGGFCRRHHTLKHATPWRVEQISHGRFRWTSPTGGVYDDHAPSTLRFIPRTGPADVRFNDPPPY